MKRLLLLPSLLAAFCAAVPARADTALVFGKESFISDTYDVFEEVWFVLVPEGECTAAWVDWEQGATRVRVPLVYRDDLLTVINSGLQFSSGWAARLPVNHAGKVTYSYTTVGSDGKPNPRPRTDDMGYEITENTGEYAADPRGLTNQRYPNIFGKWGVDQSKKLTGDSDWYGEELVRATAIPQMIRLLGTTTDAMPYATKGRSSPVAGGFVRTALGVEDGVGSIWFKARMANASSLGGVLAIDKVSYTMVNNKPKFNEPPTEIVSINVPPALSNDQWYQFHLILQDASAPNLSFRIRNKTMATNEAHRSVQAVDLCDIVLTPVIPDVKIFRNDVDYSPGFPSTEDPMTFRIAVSNLFAGAQAEFITPRLVWRQGDDDEWHNAVMTNLDATAAGQPGDYGCILAHDDGTPDDYRIDDGPFEYFYEVSFAGYTPRFPALKYPGNIGVNDIRNFEYGNRVSYPYLIHTNDWAMLTDATGTNSECRSPAYYPDFAVRAANLDVEGAGHYTPFSLSFDVVGNSPAGQSESPWGFTHLFDIRNLYGGWPVDREVCYATRVADDITAYPNRPITIPADFPYLTLRAKDGIRRFRSLYTDLAAVTADWSTNVQSHLLPAYPMQHVGDYTWQAIIHVTNYIDAAFSVTGALHAAEGGYDEGPFEWLEIDQEETDINPPMSGAMTVEEAAGVLVTNHHELVRFRTYETNRTETVTETVTTTTYEPASCTGIFVGVVINPAFYTEGYDPPTIDDVEYWFERLEETVEIVDDFDPDTGDWIGSHEETNYVAQAVRANYYTNAAGAWGPQYALHDDDRWADGDEKEIYTYVYPTAGFVPYVFTNETKTVVTGLVEKTVTTTEEHSVKRWFYAPREADIVAANGGVEPRRVRTEVDINYDGFLMYRFCTTNGSYQIRRAAWQDFNSWQADDKRYSRSAGLYDMKTFSWDLEGEDVTSFSAKRIYTKDASFDGKAYTNEMVRRAEALAAGEPPDIAGWIYYPYERTQPEPWTSAKGDGFLGYSGCFAQMILERTGRDKTSATRNGAFLLDTRKALAGSLETTDVSSDDGRDTLTMRVRSFTDDYRCITYNGNSVDPASNPSASNYRVVARLMNQDSSQVSDGEHSLSLIGYYQGAGDFWEARITQKSSLTAQTGGKPPLEKDWFEVHVYKWLDQRPTEVYGRVYQDGMGRGDSMNASTRTGPNRVAQWPLWNNNGNVNGNNNAKDDGRERFVSKTSGGWTFVFDLQTEGGNVRPAVYAFLQDNYSTFDTNKNCYAYRCDATSAGTSSVGKPFLYGRPGFNTKDCGLQIAPYVYSGFDGAELTALHGKNGSGGTMWGAVSSSTNDSWDHNNGRDYDQSHRIDVWKPVAQGNPSILERKAPTVYYRVNVYRTGLERIPDEAMSSAPSELWDEEWDAYHEATGNRMDGIQSVASWQWQEVPFPMNFWDDTYVQVQALSTDGDGDPSLALLALDDLQCVSWRGLTVKNDVGDEDDDEISWIANYAAIEYETEYSDGRKEGRKLQLDRTRANPNRTSESAAQGVSSPLLENGIGDVSFTYTVDKYPVRVRVGVLDRMGMFTTFADEELPVTAKSTPFYAYIATNITGRVYVLVQTPTNATEGALGTLHADNLRVTDYPATGATSWDIYNALVSTFPADMAQTAGLEAKALRREKFDGVSAAAQTMRSAVLNDRADKQTLNGISFEEDVPYLQTPVIETGLGEVSFWYRASRDNGDPNPPPAKIALLGRDQDGRWNRLTAANLHTNLDENPLYPEQARAMAALTNIVELQWTYFNVEFYEKDYTALRIVAGDGEGAMPEEPNRVMLDNVLITEPVRSSIDVGAIEFGTWRRVEGEDAERFVPAAPLSTIPTDVRVKLENPRMNPHNFRVYLDWYVPPTVRHGSEKVRWETVNNGISNAVIKSVYYTVWTQKVQHTVYYDSVSGTILPENASLAEKNRPGVFEANYIELVEHVDPHEDEEITRIPAGLGDRWGVDGWSGHRTGRLVLARDASNPRELVYVSTNSIPTHLYPPDTVMQFCVTVEYDGRFSKDILSEKQGRVTNGYWFENPEWYDPIDLNVAFGTADRPVSHVFLLSCPVGTAKINEFRPWMGKTANANTYLPKQFVELMGPAGASLANWRLEHWGKVGTAVDSTWIYYTNHLGPTAAFCAAADVANATTNKGWGFYILGGPDIQPQDQELFLEDDYILANPSGNHTHARGKHFLDPASGALRLRRSMGAYEDKICWGNANNVSNLVLRMGFPRMDYFRNYNNNNNAAYVYGVKGDNGDLVWGTMSSDTAGGYNLDQEDLLPWADGTEEEKPAPPLPGKPVITGFEFVDDGANVLLSFKVCVTNGVAITDENKDAIEWDVLYNSGLDGESDWMSSGNDCRFLDPIRVPAPANAGTDDDDGVWWSDVLRVKLPVDRSVDLEGNPIVPARFYVVEGTPTE